MDALGVIEELCPRFESLRSIFVAVRWVEKPCYPGDGDDLDLLGVGLAVVLSQDDAMATRATETEKIRTVRVQQARAGRERELGER